MEKRRLDGGSTGRAHMEQYRVAGYRWLCLSCFMVGPRGGDHGGQGGHRFP